MDITPLQQSLEELARERLAEWVQACADMPSSELSEFIANASHAHAEEVLREWWDLADTLVAKYADGYINQPGMDAIELGYPSTWLARTDYKDGPTTYDMKP